MNANGQIVEAADDNDIFVCPACGREYHAYYWEGENSIYDNVSDPLILQGGYACQVFLCHDENCAVDGQDNILKRKVT
jgi:hypothetical protein